MAQHDLIFYANRSTPQVVPKGGKAKPKAGYGKQTKRRAATADEEKQIAAGRWVRVDARGKKGGQPGYKKTKYRPQLVKSKGEPMSTATRIARARAAIVAVQKHSPGGKGHNQKTHAGGGGGAKAGDRVSFKFEGRKKSGEVIDRKGSLWVKFKTNASERESFGMGKVAAVRLSDAQSVTVRS